MSGGRGAAEGGAGDGRNPGGGRRVLPHLTGEHDLRCAEVRGGLVPGRTGYCLTRLEQKY